MTENQWKAESREPFDDKPKKSEERNIKSGLGEEAGFSDRFEVTRQPYEFFASCLAGLESFLADELRGLGVLRVRPLQSGVAFFGTAAIAQRVCLWSRLASRVVLIIGRVDASDAESLYRGCLELAWEEVFSDETRFSVKAKGANEELRHSGFTALKVKDAINDRWQRVRGVMPSYEPNAGEAVIDVRLRGNRATLSLDLTGESLYHRTYLDKVSPADAPLRCAQAAALLAASGWPGTDSSAFFLDPTCGDGYLLVEAASASTDQAPGILRRQWGFQHWLQFDAEAWAADLEQADDRFEAGLARLEVTDAGGVLDFGAMALVGLSSSSPSIARARDYLRHAGLHRVASVEFAEPGQSFAVGKRLADKARRREGRMFVLSNRAGDDNEVSAQTVALDADFLAACEGVKAGMKPAESCRFASIGGDGLSRRFSSEAVVDKNLGTERVSTRLQVFHHTPDSVPTVKVPDSAGGAEHRVMVNQEASKQFADRMRKVLKDRRKWASREGISCYRVYDADLPEYAVAVDVYQDADQPQDKTYVHVAEYKAPSSVDPALAKERFEDTLALIPAVLGVRPERVVAKERSRAKGGSQYAKEKRRSHLIWVEESGLRFQVDLTAYLDTGLFLDQRLTRRIIFEKAREMERPRFLNLFAYTGTASVCAADGGVASTTTVDLSQTYLDWAQRNMEENGFTGNQHRFERADAVAWVSQARRQGKKFDFIYVDPPTFSNSKAMGRRTWDVQRDHAELLIGISRLLDRDGVALFSCNLRNFKPDMEPLRRYGVELENITASTIPYDFSRTPHIHHCYWVRRVKGR